MILFIHGHDELNPFRYRQALCIAMYSRVPQNSHASLTLPSVGSKHGGIWVHHALAASDVLQETSCLASLDDHTLQSALNFAHDILSPAFNWSDITHPGTITHF